MSAPPRPAHPHPELAEPVQNRFFYGMLLNEHTLTREQRYFEDKRRLLNRLGLGHGVLAGLTYRAAGGPDPLYGLSADDLLTGGAAGGPVTHVRIAPGVALDGYGREVVVPSTTCGDELVVPIQVVDPGSGTPVDPAGGAKFVEAAKRLMTLPPEKLPVFYLVLEVRRNEIDTDPVPVRAGTCPAECRPSAVREGFAVRFRPVEKKPVPVPGAPGEEVPRGDGGWPEKWNEGDKSPTAASLLAVFPQEPGVDVRHRHAAQLQPGLASPAVPPRPGRDDPLSWVPLGVFACAVAGEGKGTTVTVTHAGRYYRQVWGTDALSRLVFGLAERVDEAARVRVLTPDGVGGASGDGQSADVHHFLARPLVVRVTDGKGGPPVDPDSIRVRFDVLTEGGGELYANGANGKPAGLLSNDDELTVDHPDEDERGTARVWWKLGPKAGPHTVLARITTKDRGHPPFHPGSAVQFHATAVPTAPTVVGLEVLGWSAPRCAAWGTAATLRVYFSRRMNPDALKMPDRWLRVLWMVGKPDPTAHAGDEGAIIPHGPYRIQKIELHEGPLHPHDPRSPAAVGGTDDERECWYADYTLPDLLGQLCKEDTLRVLVMIRPTKPAGQEPGQGDLASVPGALYPVAQQLDADYDGSFVPPTARDDLWHWRESPHRPLSAAMAVAAQRPADSPAPHDHLPDRWALWRQFHPRDARFPSGDGTEGLAVRDDEFFGGDFHKAFEFRLPRC